jgi:hypothetical protein
MKFRVRTDDEKGEFEVEDVRLVDAKMRRLLGLVVVPVCLLTLLIATVAAAINGHAAALNAAIVSATVLTGAVMRFYFKKPDG